MLVFFGEDEGGAVDGVAFGGGGAVVFAFEAGPFDADIGVVPGEAAFVVGVVEVVTFVAEFGVVGEDEEAVGESAGDEVLFFVFFGEGLAVPFAVGGGAGAEVDGDVKDGAFDDADEFGLGVVDLEVEAAEDAFAGFALVVLDEGVVEAGFAHVGEVVGLHEVAAVVAVDGGGDGAESFDSVNVFFYCDLSHGGVLLIFSLF